MRTDWRDRGACVGADPELFFPSRGHGGSLAPAAKAICAGCPVLEACLDHGLRYETHGIWGGTTGKERRQLRRRRGIRLQVPEASFAIAYDDEEADA